MKRDSLGSAFKLERFFMESAVTEKNGLKRKLEMTVPAKEVASCFLKNYQKIQKKAKLQGFRAGKVPMELIKKNYKDHVLKDVMDDLFRAFYPLSLKDHQIHPAGPPKLIDLDLQEGKDCKFLFELEVHPEVKVENYLNLEIHKKEIVVKDEELEQTIEKLRESSASFEDSLLQTGPLKNGDFFTLKLSAFDFQNKQLLNFDNLLMELGKDMVAPGFDNKLLGLNLDGEREFEFLFPKDHPNGQIAGMNLKVKVKLTGFKNKKLPDLNDEFAKKFKAENIKELKEKVRDDLYKNLKVKQEEEVENSVVDQLVAKNPVDLPQNLIEDQKKNLKENAEKRLEGYKVPAHERSAYLNKHDKEFEKEAKASLHISYIMQTLIKDLKISANKDDIQKSLKESFPTKTPEDMEKELKNNNYWDHFIFNLTRKKLISHLIENAKIIKT